MGYTGLYVMLAIIFLIVISNRHLFWWIKAIIVAYYSVISYIFITTKNKIDRQYENILPVPDAYWDKNSGWVNTMVGYYFWPLAVILLFIYFKWYRSRQSKTAKGWVVVSFIPATAIFLIITFFFGFGYGYRP
ncbi:hypothetical protein [Peribacillus frigoritolerans]|uniref:hypothetical protein n=1 Tax=Peribacillus frigoritolerans TaxID=450367 RepID=UPI0025A1B58E|nr:hypothetical protein [Peribacillus frigoritolerans]MDM5304296.1 hypothetical protein [Peribacillus frigoritolerans]